ncbi:AAA family ATPase [Levilactobacillus suantsaiihabitans]|uniref:ATP-binding protein n=1 Tax=Levilactobacillus suantsaiihabitans TaxID=2487722 RepID=A0A4Z0J966_9LACO|nr:AAA family ATPase [Levilactobacillus suantsaiihabitans]TGD18040.1 ATP-binding protein [Levilactobacillus suantsaiihabitans]
MRIQNLGPIKDATITLNRLTVFIGKNSTGKTLASYAIFAFRTWLATTFQSEALMLGDFQQSAAQDETKISTVASRQRLVGQIIADFNALNDTGAYFQTFFPDANVYRVGVTRITADECDVARLSAVEGGVNLADPLEKSVYVPVERLGLTADLSISSAEKQAIFENTPYPIAAYCQFLNESLRGMHQSDTALPQSVQTHLSELIPGTFTYDENRGQIWYQPDDTRSTKVKLSLASTSVKSLLGLDLFLRRTNGGYLLLDEPEMGLHPSQQKRLLDLLYAVALKTTPVVMVTHSDYLVKELVNLILQAKVAGSAEAGQVVVYEFTAGGVRNLGDISVAESLSNFDDTTDAINQRYYQLLDQLSPQ